MKDKQFKEDNGDENKYALIGTAEYIFPEMINEGKCGIAGDLWALGINPE
jgi:serine/threonine protein kinase